MSKEFIRTTSVISNVPSLGDFIYFNNMNEAGSFAESGTSGYEISRSIDHFLTPPSSLCLKTKSATPSVNDSVVIQKSLPSHPNNKISSTFYASFNSSNALLELISHYYSIKGTVLQDYGFKFKPADGTIYYLNSANNWTLVSGYTFIPSDDAFAKFQLSVDFANQKYISLLINNILVDLSSYAPKLSTGQTTNYSKFQLLAYATAAARAIFYLDGVEIKQI